MNLILLLLFFAVTAVLVYRNALYIIPSYFVLWTIFGPGFTVPTPWRTVNPSYCFFVVVILSLFLSNFRNRRPLINWSELSRDRWVLGFLLGMTIVLPVYNYLVWGYVTDYFLRGHVAALWTLILPLAAGSRIKFKSLVKIISATAIVYMVTFFPHSIEYWLITKGRGLGRERDLIFLEPFCERALRFCPDFDNIWFKMNLPASYLASVSLAVLISVIVYRAIRTKSFMSFFLMILALETVWIFVYINQYITQNAVVLINVVVAVFLILWKGKFSYKWTKGLFIVFFMSVNIYLSFFLPATSASRASELVMRNLHMEKVELVHTGIYAGHSAMRPSLLYTSLVLLVESGLQWSGTGEPPEASPIKGSISPEQKFLNGHYGDLVDYWIVYGFPLGSLTWLFYVLPLLFILIKIDRFRLVPGMVFFNVFLSIFLMSVVGNMAGGTYCVSVYLLFFYVFSRRSGLFRQRNLFLRH